MKTSSLDKTVLIDTVGTDVRGTVGSWIKGIFGSIRTGMELRATMRQLSTLDDALLRDIGIAQDEIARVRRGDAFTPRAWL
jgi:uncharacterized protein YjiS (DUF1127 family)